MQTTLALAALGNVETYHRGGHRCDDGRHYNDNTGTRTMCPVRAHLRTAAEQVEKLHARVHEAAHSPRHIEAVAVGLLAGTPLTDLPVEQREGWLMMARQAVEALSWSLDGDSDLTERARTAAARTGGPDVR